MIVLLPIRQPPKLANNTKNMAGQPSVISGWTAFSSQSLSPTGAKDPVAEMADSTALASQDNLDNSQTPTSDSPQTQQEKDQALLADPPRLTGLALLGLCKRYSTRDIVDLTNAAAGVVVTSLPTINSRLNAALLKSARETGRTKDEVRDELTEHRKSLGIRSTRRVPFKRMGTVANATKTKSDQTEPAPQADVAATTQALDHTGDTTEENSDADMEDDNGDAARLALERADHAAFVDQNSLFGEKMLLIAERYSDPEISAHICAILGNFPLTKGGVANRIHSALKARADATGISLKDAREALNVARAASGALQPSKKGKGVLKVSRHRQPTPATTAPVASHVTAPVASQVAAAVTEQIDIDMTDEDGTSGQEGWNADEIDAANTLLKLVAGDEEVQETATILLNMHRDDALLAGQPDQAGGVIGENGDTNMNDVEMGETPGATHGEYQKYAAQEEMLVGLLKNMKRGYWDTVM